MMKIEAFFDERTWTLTYVVFDEKTRDAVIIDPVLDYNPVGSKVWTESVDRVTDFVWRAKLNPHYVLETHAHADHLSGSQVLKSRLPSAKVAIGRNITKVQAVFKAVFELPDAFAVDGSQFDTLIRDGEVLRAGSLEIRAIATPGHTPACLSYLVGDALFTGDTLFMPDMGTGRCDFPAGSVEDLYDSVVHKIYSFPDDTRVFVGHDYMPGGRGLSYETTVADQKRGNVQLNAATSREEFLAFRKERDAGLEAPKLLYPSVQVNLDAGHLPDKDRTGSKLLKVPINVFCPSTLGATHEPKV